MDPNSLSEAFAISSGNSLYVAGALLCDPMGSQLSRSLVRC